mgnify:CR=1 FL=1
MLYFLTEKKQKGAYKNMSQAKVDRYKEEKKNRKQTIKKEKRNRVLGRTLGVVIAAAIVCWIGFSGYSYYQEKKPMTKTELSMTALNEYMCKLSSTDSATEYPFGKVIRRQKVIIIKTEPPSEA